MRKDDLIMVVMAAAGLATKKQATDVVNAMIDTIVKTLSKGEEVVLPGLGKFEVRKMAARMGVNPKTGAKIKIAAKKAPKFKAAKALKDAVK